MDHGFSLWLEFEEWKPPGDDESAPYFNMQVTLADGRVYALNVWITDAVPRIVRSGDDGGSELSRRYAVGPDLLVERMDRELLEEVVSDLIRQGEMRDHWLSGE